MKKNLIIISIIFIGLALATYMLVLVKKASNQVLESLGTINEKFEEINADNQMNFDSIQSIVMYSEYKDTFERFDIINQDFNYYIENVKAQLLANVDDPKKYSDMETTSVGDAYFFNSDGSYSEQGQNFVNYIENYKKEVSLLFRNESIDIDEELNELFNKHEKVNDWLEYNFKGFPLVASITNLTSMSIDVGNLKMKLLNKLLAK